MWNGNIIGSVDTILVMTSLKRDTHTLGSSPDEPLSQSLHKPVVLVINNNYFDINNIRNYLFDINNIIAVKTVRVLHRGSLLLISHEVHYYPADCHLK